MTSANQLIEYGPMLNRVLDPGSEGFVGFQESRNPLGVAVLSVLTSRQAFWVTQSLVAGYALDVDDATTSDDGRPEYVQLFGRDRFAGYVSDSGFDPYGLTLLDTTRVLDSVLTVQMRETALAATVALNLCLQGCANGDDSCVRRCIIEWG